MKRFLHPPYLETSQNQCESIILSLLKINYLEVQLIAEGTRVDGRNHDHTFPKATFHLYCCQEAITLNYILPRRKFPLCPGTMITISRGFILKEWCAKK